MITRKNLFSLVIVLIASLNVRAQEYKVGLKVSLQITNFYGGTSVGSNLYSFRISGAGGISISRTFGCAHNISLRSGFFVNDKGPSYSFEATDNSGASLGRYKSIFNLCFFSMPFCFVYKPNGFQIGLGPEIEYLFQASIYSDFNKQFESFNKQFLRPFLPGFIFFVGYEKNITPQCSFILDFSYSRQLQSFMINNTHRIYGFDFGVGVNYKFKKRGKRGYKYY